VLPIHGDSLAPPRPDRAEPPVSALAVIGHELVDLAELADLAELPELPPLPPTDDAAPVRPAPAEPVAPVKSAPSVCPAPPVQAASSVCPASPVRPAPSVRPAPRAGGFEEPKGCLYALSQPPLMLFLCVIGSLLGAGAAWDLLFL
jgi:hypothetical protein